MTKSTEWITADNHAGHRNILGYCKRPFANVDEMCEELERAWHAKLTAWHLYQRAQEERTTTEAEALLPAAWATEEEYEALLRKCELAWSYSWYERQLAERGLSRHGMSVGPCW